MGLSSRLKTICDNKKIKNIDLVKIGCGSEQTISFVLNGKSKPNSQFLEVFLKAYPDINARWLLTGEGDDHVEEPRTLYGFCRECVKKEGRIEQLEKQCAAKDKRIEELLIKNAGLNEIEDQGKKAS